MSEMQNSSVSATTGSHTAHLRNFSDLTSKIKVIESVVIQVLELISCM